MRQPGDRGRSTHHLRGDGNENSAHALAGQWVRGAGDMFTTTLTGGAVRESHTVEFEILSPVSAELNNLHVPRRR